MPAHPCVPGLTACTQAAAIARRRSDRRAGCSLFQGWYRYGSTLLQLRQNQSSAPAKVGTVVPCSLPA
jgi:hypothetical protein